MKSLIFGLCGVFALGSLAAQKGGWEPSPGHKQVPIWPVAAPDPQPVRGPEVVEPSGNTFLVAGREVIGVSNVTRPHDDGIFTQGKEYRRRGPRLPRRGLSDFGHRP